LKKILGKAPPISEAFLDEEGEYLWIVKPTCLNRGRGIQVFSRLDALTKFVSDNLCGYV
jgi:phosphoribosylamine-glycine ligase